MSAAVFKKQFSENFSALELPKPLEGISPEDLASRMEHKPASVVIIDVRAAADFAKGHLAGSRNVALDEFLEHGSQALVTEAAEAYKKGTPVEIVFVSLQSPDIDEAAALAFTRSWDDHVAEGGKDGKLPDSHTFVHILLGGALLFFQLFNRNPKLVLQFDHGLWDPLMAKTGDASA
jgi:rhodanese-related sulfurtransferase